MDPEKQRLTALARRLAAATAARSAKWQVDEDDAYVWAGEKGSVTIASRGRDAEPSYELAVFSLNRERVDELTSGLLENNRPAPWNEALVELYRAARRSALGADDLTDALIEALSPDEANGEARVAGRATHESRRPDSNRGPLRYER
jgi:hypothetical protein